MDELEIIVKQDPDTLLKCLPSFQEKIIRAFMDQGKDYIESADTWLSAKPNNTVGFGGESGKPIIYRDAIINEVEKFICGDSKYLEDRKKIGTNVKFGVGVIAHAIGTTLGASGPFLLPVIVLVIINMGRIPVNAWCEMRKSQRDKNEIDLP